ncbi:SDR family oxidoreductase [Alphaproteobacteria bacterium]|jgi:ribitol 2-dehydrogenase|nr:SDR family oxidoreductase [Alphaproteobacteria bacterium]MDB4234166.1 SDR family oxidoreductase [Alphaproteobacteria bacterium]
MKSNKVMLITGATSGVGKALAEHFYKKNYKLVLVGGSKEKVNKQSKKFKKNTLFLCADLTKSEDIKMVVTESITKFKKIDILIANAGLYEPDKIISGNPDRWDRVISVNVTSVFRLVNLVLPYMKKNKFGDIAITSSISGHQAIHWEPIYSASKHAIQSFAHGLRTQVSKNNIRVISIAPGMIMTELWDLDPIKNKKYIENMIKKGNALDVKEVVSCFDFALSRGRGANIRDLVILPTNQNL